MTRHDRHTPSPSERVAQLAVAQYLLFDATVESLSMLTERFVHPRSAREAGETEARDLVEPFRTRYAFLRRMVEEPKATSGVAKKTRIVRGKHSRAA